MVKFSFRLGKKTSETPTDENGQAANSGLAPPAEPVPPVPPPAPLPPPPPGGNAPQSAEAPEQKAYHDELQFWQERMLEDQKRLRIRNWLLRGLVVFGVVVLGVLLVWIHQCTIGRYAVLENVQVTQNACNQGQLDIVFDVVKPGKVYCRRKSGDLRTDVVDVYHEPGTYRRPWSWTYRPGSPIDVRVWSRSGLFMHRESANFPTADKIDVVILIDTTGSMDSSLNDLKEKCVDFAQKLRKQSLKPRFALVGFGDTGDGDWVTIFEFTEDIQFFQQAVAGVERYNGGVDLEESALDALQQALALVQKDEQNEEQKGNVKRFYLVTDATYHPQTQAGKLGVGDIAKLLRESGVQLDIFARQEFRADYEPLQGEGGSFREIENFGKALAEGRVLED